MNPYEAPSLTEFPTLDRRDFLRLTSFVGGGLVLGSFLKISGTAHAAEIAKTAPSGDFTPNAYVRLGLDGSITLICPRPDSGQGVKTSLPMILAEDLEVSWQSVTVQMADLNAVYGSQTAGGSTSTPTFYLLLRQLGTTARVMLIDAAAQTWGVPAAECFAEAASVHHKASKKSLPYRDLVAKAATLPVPDAKQAVLKDPKDFKLLGQRIGGVDNQKIVTGQNLFGLDFKLPGLVYAVFEKCPVFGGKVVSANLDRIKTLPGVKDAFIIDGTKDLRGLMPGVAILADSTWAAFSARRQLKVTWDEGAFANDSWDGFTKQAQDLAAKGTGNVVRKDGDVDAAFASAAKVVESAYSYPFISHANLEPQNCTASVTADRAEIWAPTQNPGAGADIVAKVLNIPKENITVHILRAGGGFGRRLSADFVIEAAAIAQKAGVPVKLVWSREDDLRHDHFRPGGFHFLKGSVDAAGKISGFRNHSVFFAGGLGADEFPSRFIPNHLGLSSVLPNNVPMGPWRAPGSCVFSFVYQSFIDELAHAAGRDPVEIRLELLGDKGMVPGTGERGTPYNAARMKAVVKLVAEKAGWGKKLPRGQGMGIAFHFSHRGYIAQVAEVTVSKSGDLKVDRVVCVSDVGSQIVNLSGAENQVEGSIVDGLSAAWRQELNIERGRIVESNLAEYQLIRMPDAPKKIECHFLKSDNPPTGLGEPVLPPLAPAVANAIFAATGKRIRQLPFAKTDLSWS
ncbi:MAG: xanthine dehydrogenase family protein molybdopterin-binding subunit [Undibacterium sp.]|nr:xanthine dehydrogenase family protein molybdopterin-binding subunit [Opitutaceae bacterium]